MTTTLLALALLSTGWMESAHESSAESADKDGWGPPVAPASRFGTEEYECSGDLFEAGDVWGTDAYTSDSDVCAAALHAGVIRQGRPASVYIEWRDGRTSYTGSFRNGIASKGYGSWDRSFVFVGGPTPPEDFQRAQRKDEPAPENMKAWRGRNGELVEIVCGVADFAEGTVWGNGWYADDSSPCRAALHAGVVERSGGTVLLQISEGREEYGGSVRHGVVSHPFDAWVGSFFFPGAPPESFPAGTRSMRKQLHEAGFLDRTVTLHEGKSTWEITFFKDGRALFVAHERGRTFARVLADWNDDNGAIDVEGSVYLVYEDRVTDHLAFERTRIALVKDGTAWRLESDGAPGFHVLRPR